ncbi:hypothetical protein CMU16_18590, partial [Elizabethkingia anophelis]|nr:hypothetical protein [Elizabethkingia anophelis]
RSPLLILIYYTISGTKPDISFSVIYKEEIRAKKGIWAFMNKCFQQMLTIKKPFLNRVEPYIKKEIPCKMNIILNFSHPYSDS